MRLADDAADAVPPNAVKDGEDGEFAAELDVFSGPFFVLLPLIARKRLDVIEAALAEVTDESIAFVRSYSKLDLPQVSEFPVVAATLFEIKATCLLPRDSQEEEDLELLERCDPLFTKLLRHRAFKEVARDIVSTLAEQAPYVPCSVPLEERHARMVPVMTISIGLTDSTAFTVIVSVREHRKLEALVEYLHAAPVSVASQVEYIAGWLTAGERLTLADLCANATNMLTVVSRFLAVLELLQAGRIDVEQPEALGMLVLVVVDPPEPEAGVRQPGEADDSGYSQESQNFGDSNDSGDARDLDDSRGAHGQAGR